MARRSSEADSIRRLLDTARLDSSSRVLDLGWNGSPLLPSADSFHADSRFYTTDIRLARDARSALGDASVIASETATDVGRSRYDAAVYHPSAHAGKVWMFHLIDLAFQALETGGRFVLSGNRDRGIESLARHVETVFGSVETASRQGRWRVYVAVRRDERPGAPPAGVQGGYEVTDLEGGPFTFESTAGVFSWDGLDPGSRLLLETVDIGAGDRILDIGCGVGVLGIVAGKRSSSGGVLMVDADLRAVGCARRNLDHNGLPNASAAAGDLVDGIPEDAPRFDQVLTNPPFHEGRSTGDALVDGAARVLHPGGRLHMVVMRPAGYLRQMKKRFRKVESVHELGPYTILAAEGPEMA